MEHDVTGAGKLKVVHLATTDFGGAGKAAYRLHKGLQGCGVDSTMLVLTRRNCDPSVRTLPGGHPGGSFTSPEQYPVNSAYARRIGDHWSAMLARYPERRAGMDLFSDDYSEVRLECSQEIREADIVNLHWVAGVFNCLNAPLALRGKKVVWTMHDMNPFTGGCHYSAGCTAYRRNCGNCPLLGSRKEQDLSRSTWDLKRYAYAKLDLTAVTPSRWLGKAASESSLFSRSGARVIPNGCPADVFTPCDRRHETRREHGVPDGAKVVLFGAGSLLSERKGLVYLLQALKSMPNEGIVLACFGKLPQDIRIAMNVRFIDLGVVEEERTLAALYSMADLFVIPSLEDNLPNTVVEAMLCGVPVAGFDVGGIPEMVQHKRTGYLVPARDVAGLADAISWCLFSPAAEELPPRCRETALARYSLTLQADKYCALYREILAAAQEEKRAPAPGRMAQGAAPRTCFRTAVHSPPSPLRISLVIPSYNYGRYLEECLDSILSQNYHGLELVIMDGGSTDQSRSIIERHRKHLAYWQSRPDGGQYSAIEEGFLRTSGELMGWLNADDKFHPGAFATASAIFREHPEVEWLMGRPNSFDEKGTQKVVLSYLPLNSRAKYLADQELIQQEGIFWRRRLWERSGGYLAKEFRLAADLELWARFFRSTPLYSVDTLIAGFRDHPLQKSKDKAGYSAEANRILAREREIFSAEKNPYSPPPPLPFLVKIPGAPR